MNKETQEALLTHPLVTKACEFAIKAHGDTNHMRDGKPYDTHLRLAADYALRFSYLLSEDDRPTVIAGAWTHDSIEDARKSYNDVKEATSTDVAEITYACTNEKGKNRKERANEKYYDGIRQNLLFIYVKICDRLANVEDSAASNGRMLALYRKEHEGFRAALTTKTNVLDPMWDELERLLGLR